MVSEHSKLQVPCCILLGWLGGLNTQNITFFYGLSHFMRDHFFLLQLNFQFMKRCVESGPTTSIQDEWYDNILELIPHHLKDKKEYRDALKALFEEVVTDFAKSMKKSMGRYFVNFVFIGIH